MRRLSYRQPTIDDVRLYFDWANDAEVRKQSFSSNEIDFVNHCKWFISKIADPNCMMLIFQEVNKNKEVGQIRITKQEEKSAVIGISVGSEFRGKGYAREMLMLASDLFLKNNPTFIIHAYIKKENFKSKKSFEGAGFIFNKMVVYEKFESFHYLKKQS
ncbi:MAG: GNAT family N-acetyltransferase [Bacteroidetes bacterium]|nr:GNAT family N-acetyltransferase [Bacteroidota bacterium]MBS1649820.1 GNAT family N-acetyltransferase [Bacteroidota bacterium]